MNSIKEEIKSIFYVSIFISLIFNLHKVLRVFGETNVVIEYLWSFNLFELIYQILFQILFCYLIGFITLKVVQNDFSNKQVNLKMISTLLMMTVVFWFIGFNIMHIFIF